MLARVAEWETVAGVLTLVVDLACGLDEVLKMGTCEEITQVDKFAVPLILDVDGTPAVLAGGDVAAGLVLADVVL